MTKSPIYSINKHYHTLMVRNYELYAIIDAELSESKRADEISRIQTILTTDVGAENIVVTEEGAKKLAYPIAKKRVGYYVSVTFDVAYEKAKNMVELERKLNVSDNIVRYIIDNLSEYNRMKSSENRNEKATVSTHQEFNKGKKVKQDLAKHLGISVINYKDIDFLSQYTSPYAKIFARHRTGNSAKMQRKITTAIKRARHMALMPFTPIHERVI